MKIEMAYNKKDDILYISMNNRPAKTIEMDDGVLLRLDPDTNEFIGLTILFFNKFFKDLCNEENLVFSDEFIKIIKAGMKDAKEGRFLTHEEVFGEKETVPINPTSIREYLDKCIIYSRKQLKNSKTKKDKLMAKCYIDAYQSVRVSLLGKLLPKEE